MSPEFIGMTAAFLLAFYVAVRGLLRERRIIKWLESGEDFESFPRR